MTGNPIFVRYGMAHLAQCEDWEWTCTRCKPKLGTYGYEWTAAAAADAGRAHLRECHGWMPPAEALALHRALAPLGPRVTVDEPGYSRACGVHTASCGAAECECVSVDPDAENGPHRAADAFRPV